MLRFGPLVPGLNSGDDGVGVGSADAIEDDRSADKQLVDTALEVSRGQVGVKVGSGTGGSRVDVAVTRQRAAGDAESLCRPGECVRRALQLSFADRFFLEVPFADDEEVTGGVVFGVGVTGDRGVA
jgi:hypothetical protein